MPKHTLRELLTFACCFMIAGVVWYGHSMGTVRNLIVPIEISYQGLSPIIECKDTLPTSIRVELHDVGHRLKVYQQHPPVIHVDISQQVMAEKGTITLSSELLRTHISNQIQGTTTIQAVLPEQVKCRYVRLHKKTVPIQLQGTFTPASQYQMVGEPQLQDRSVVLYGTYHAISAINEVKTEPLVLSNIQDTVQAIAQLIAPSHIRLSQSAVSVRVVSERFTEQVMTIPLEADNVPEGEVLRLFPSEVEVRLRIGVSHFASLSEEQVHAVCHYPTRTQERLTVHVKCNNPWVTYVRSNPSSVEYIIEQ